MLRGIIFLVMVITMTTETISQTTHILTVRGECTMCSDRILEAAREMNGVLKAEYNLNQEQLTVKASEDFIIIELHNKLAGLGHATDLVKANQEAYDQLPACCAYAYDEFETTEVDAGLPEIITGMVYELDEDGNRVGLIGANIRWSHVQTGTSTDENGFFEIGRISGAKALIFSYVGYRSDTVDMIDVKTLEVIMSDDVRLQEIEVVYKEKTTSVDYFNPIQTLNITEQELCKAACCNLSESFETSPSIDVSFTDAVTGTRQIEMLGLAGKYVQITRELIPDIRGLSTIHGFTYIPGAWIKSIQLSKGTGSVVNGHESMTGQINVELRKPQNDDRLYLNLYANQGGRFEGNLSLTQKINQNWSTGVLLHGSSKHRINDRNKDGFLDNPIGDDFIFVNRWKYQSASGWQGQLGIRGVFLEKQAGQKKYDFELDEGSDQIWGSHSATEQLEAWTKIGKVFSNEKESSLGFQLSYLQLEKDDTYGLRSYDGVQNSLFANLIYQTRMVSKDHLMRAGVSFKADDISETTFGQKWLRDEKTIGAYLEYTYEPNPKFTAVAGFRADNHNLFGLMYTPRVHLRYALWDETTFRANAGKGWRTANVFSENPGIFARNQRLEIQGEDNDLPYGLNAEESWNFGTSLTQGFRFGQKSGTLSIDYYYTVFQEQVVSDRESNPEAWTFYNQLEESFAHSVQIQLDYELFQDFDVRAAYRFNDAQVVYGDQKLQRPLTSRHRAFINLGYKTPSNWFFDLTVNWQGEKRIPGLNQRDVYSPDFITMNGQISKRWNELIDVYVGSENVLNYTQDNPIVQSDDPFSSEFDATQIWGPIFGRNIYVGLRYRVL